MLSRSSNLKRGCTRARRGAVTPLVIAVFPALMAALVLATQVASLRHRSLELQINTDADALAGANALVPTDDLLLFGADPIPNTTRDAIFSSVRDIAVNYATLNQFLTQGITLSRNDSNAAGGELVIGTMNQPFDATFDTDITTNPWNLYVPRYNSVQVAVRRGSTYPLVGGLYDGNVAARVRTFVDRDVVGFKVQGSSVVLSGTDPAIPVLPLAIRTDYLTSPPTDAGSWDHQIIYRNGSDNCSIATGTPVCGNPPGPANPDGIPEIVVTFSGLMADNGQMVAVPSTSTVADAIGQVTTGITYTQLAAYDPTNQSLTLATGATNEVTLNRLLPTAGDFASFATALGTIAGARRVWMLYDSPAAGTVRVVGFVAARVMRITNNVTSVDVTLQPTMLITCDAQTDFTRRDLGPRVLASPPATIPISLFNPYISRNRIAQ